MGGERRKTVLSYAFTIFHCGFQSAGSRTSSAFLTALGIFAAAQIALSKKQGYQGSFPLTSGLCTDRDVACKGYDNRIRERAFFDAGRLPTIAEWPQLCFQQVGGSNA